MPFELDEDLKRKCRLNVGNSSVLSNNSPPCLTKTSWLVRFIIELFLGLLIGNVPMRTCSKLFLAWRGLHMMAWGILRILVWRVLPASIHPGMLPMVAWRMLCLVNLFRIDAFDAQHQSSSTVSARVPTSTQENPHDELSRFINPRLLSFSSRMQPRALNTQANRQGLTPTGTITPRYLPGSLSNHHRPGPLMSPAGHNMGGSMHYPVLKGQTNLQRLNPAGTIDPRYFPARTPDQQSFQPANPGAQMPGANDGQGRKIGQ